MKFFLFEKIAGIASVIGAILMWLYFQGFQGNLDLGYTGTYLTLDGLLLSAMGVAFAVCVSVYQTGFRTITFSLVGACVAFFWLVLASSAFLGIEQHSGIPFRSAWNFMSRPVGIFVLVMLPLHIFFNRKKLMEAQPGLVA